MAGTAEAGTAVVPFELDIPGAVLDDLTARLDRTVWPVPFGRVGDHGRDGPDPGFMQSLAGYWRSGFDWRAQEQMINAFPQVTVTVEGVRLHAVHVRGRGPDPLPLVLTHGWPSTFSEFLKLVPALADPAGHGGQPGDAFDVVVPSLPGYPLSDPLPAGQSGRIPRLWVKLMAALGYERFAAHGGDIGSYVTNRLAVEYPGRLVGIHVTYPAEPHLDLADPGLPPDVRSFVVARPRQREAGGAYAHVHRSRPLTLAYALSDSPVGLAAWILDKWREWSGGDLERSFTRDELLTVVTLYWVTGSIGSSLAPYRDWGLGAPPELVAELHPHALPGIEPAALPPGTRIQVPAAVASFHVRYPRAVAERAYSDLRQWTEMASRSHFPALEDPDALAVDFREFFRPLRAAR